MALPWFGETISRPGSHVTWRWAPRTRRPDVSRCDRRNEGEGGSLDTAKLQLVQQSLGRCLLNQAHGLSFLDAFYAEFLNCDPRIKPLFAGTDLEKQKHLLRHGLTMMTMYAGGSGLATSAVGQLAVRHDRDHLNIEPGLYRLWFESLLACVKKYGSSG